MTIMLMQCLCEHRHCIMAALYDDADPELPESEVRAGLQAIVAKIANPWCRICRSKLFRYENGKTPFSTVAEGMPIVQRLEALNIASGDLLEQINNVIRAGAN